MKSTPMKPVLIMVIVFISFALLHSILASSRFKSLAVRMAGETWMRAYYRLAYTIFSIVTSVAAVYIIVIQPDMLIYRPPGYILWSMRAVQLLGLALLCLAAWPFDIGYFTGVRQAAAYLKTKQVGGDIEGMPEGGLITTGLYGLVRHPQYLGGMLLFAFEPQITVNSLVLRILAIGYFVWGAFIEERRLRKGFGEAYADYQQDVPMFNILKGIIKKRARHRT